VVAGLRPLVVGRHLSRPRLAPDAVTFELSGAREHRLWLDAGRGSAGVYLVRREVAQRLSAASGDTPSGRARQALLHLRKHVEGARVSRLERVPGERTLVLEAGASTLVLRVGGAPALTLAKDAALATIGAGPAAWPPPAPAPEREWDRVDPEAFAAAVAASLESGRSPVRAVLAACPGLGPALARETDGGAASFRALRARLGAPLPTLLAPGPAASWHDAALEPQDALVLAPVTLTRPGLVRVEAGSWLETTALFLEARRRGLLFGRLRRRALDQARKAARRLQQLEANLASDLGSLDDESLLRRQGEALLAFGHGLPAGAESAELPDPRDGEVRLLLRLDPRLPAPANAERLFGRARRSERARREIELRLRETRSSLAQARSREASLLDARDTAELAAHEGSDGSEAEASAPGGPRHYLTTHGLSLLVGRGARENHHLTFRVARPEDLWLHARDVPGAHVVLRDGEGRAGAEDLREAAEVAAFFSEARGAALVDVHVTRRKHVRPARGGPGRVFVSHSDTLRVPPRDPAGRLRRRP
jgi:hypothetical protein